MSFRTRKKCLLCYFVAAIIIIIGISGIFYFTSTQPEHVVFVSSDKRDQIRVNNNPMGKTPTLLKLKENAKIKVGSFDEHDVKGVLKNDTIFFSNSPIESKFEAQLYEEVINALETENGELKPSDKLYLARSYFAVGKFYYTKAILDPQVKIDINLENKYLTRKELDSFSCSERAEIFMYLGYSDLNLGNESGAFDNFTEAFKRNLYLEINENAFPSKDLPTIERAKINVQVDEPSLPLDLIVAVDTSLSVLKGQGERIANLQRGVRATLKSTDRVVFCAFGEKADDLRFPGNQLPRQTFVIKVENRKATWTGFHELFTRLRTIYTERDREVEDFEIEDFQKRRTAVLIISDGEHSVPGDEGGGKPRIPDDVSEAIKDYAAFCKDIPVVIVTLDRIDRKKQKQLGSDYEDFWTNELSGHCIGKSLYYESSVPEREILDGIFDIITPSRNKVLVTRLLKDENEEDEGNFFEDVGDNRGLYEVKVRIHSTLPKGYSLYVKCSPDGETELELSHCKWQETGTPLLSVGGLVDAREETIKIVCKDIKNAFKKFHPRDVQKFMLTFDLIPPQEKNHKPRKIGTIPLLFQKERLRIRITKLSKGPVVLLSGNSTDLELQAEIDSLDNPLDKSPDHPFKRPIYLTAGMSEVDSCKLIKKTVPIPVHTTSESQRHKFNLTIQTGDVNGFKKEVRDNIKFDFQSNDDSTAYFIDDSDVEKVDFRIVNGFFYDIYRITQFIWVPLLATILFVSYHFNKEQFQGLRDVFKSPQVSILAKLDIGILYLSFIVFVIWIFWPSYVLSGLIAIFPMLFFIVPKAPKRFHESRFWKRSIIILSLLFVLLVVWLLRVFWPSPGLWILLSIPVLIPILWIKPELALIIVCVCSLMFAALLFWIIVPWSNWYWILGWILIPFIPVVGLIFGKSAEHNGVVGLIFGKSAEHSGNDCSGNRKQVILSAEVLFGCLTITVGDILIGMGHIIVALFRYIL